MSVQNLPQALQAITQSVTTATRDMIAAANEMRAFLGLAPLLPSDTPPVTLADHLTELREATAEAVGHAHGIADSVAAFLGTRYQPTQPGTPEPQPLVVSPILATPAPSIADQAEIERQAEIHERIAETQDAEPERIEVAVIRDPEPTYTTEPDAEPVEVPTLPATVDELDDAPLPDTLAGSNGYHDGELVGAGATPTPTKTRKGRGRGRS